MSIDTQPLEVIDFSGGITDYYIDGRPEQAQVCDNLLINANKKPVTRPGCESIVDAQLPLGAFRVNHLVFYASDLFTFQNRRSYYVSAGAWLEVEGPTSDGFFPNGANDMVISTSEWQGHIYASNDEYASPQKLYKDGSSVYQVRNAGLPAVPSGITVPSPTGAGETYLYAFVLRYDYSVATVAFLDRGPVYLYPTAVTGGIISGGNTVSITLPTALTTVENWDAANIKIEIYRTVTGGDVFYKVGQVTLGTTPFVDNVPDATLENNETLYTTGDIVSNGTPPKCKFLHVVNDIGYYASLKDGTELKEYEFRQSVPGDPDAVPPEFFGETEQKIKGFSSIFDRPIVFCEEYVYRVDGARANDSTGDIITTRIDDHAGCMGQNSIVRTHKGIFWAGINGFYWSDGFKVQMISTNLNKTTYKAFITSTTRQEHITGTYDPSEDRIYWAVSKEDGGGEPDMWIVLDLKWGISEACSFQTCSGGASFMPTAMAFKDKTIYRGDTRGYVLKHNASFFTDKEIDTTIDPFDWQDITIVHDYKSCFLDFGSKFVRKFVPRILISAANTTNLSLAIRSSNDNNRVTGDLKPIRYRSNITWGDSLPLWGDAEAIWDAQGIIEEWRRFPARGLRCNYKQVQLTNAEVQIFTSTLLGTAVVDPALKTATLSGGSQWTTDIFSYYISFENDNYTVQYLITERTSATVITFDDPNNAAPNGAQNFVVRGMPKGEVLELNGYVIHWSYLSKTHTPFTASSLGSNPT